MRQFLQLKRSKQVRICHIEQIQCSKCSQVSKNDHLVSKFIQLVVIFVHTEILKVGVSGVKQGWHKTCIERGMSKALEATATYARRITGRTAAAEIWASRQNLHHAQDAYSTAEAARVAAARTIELLAPYSLADDLIASAQIS